MPVACPSRLDRQSFEQPVWVSEGPFDNRLAPEEWVDDSVRNRETVLAVSLDIANAFKSLSWSVIHLALESKADIGISQVDIELFVWQVVLLYEL